MFEIVFGTPQKVQRGARTCYIYSESSQATASFVPYDMAHMIWPISLRLEVSMGELGKNDFTPKTDRKSDFTWVKIA